MSNEMGAPVHHEHESSTRARHPQPCHTASGASRGNACWTPTTPPTITRADAQPARITVAAANCAAIPVPVLNVAALVLAANVANPRPHPEIERRLTKAIKIRGSFPDEQAATKLIYLAITEAERSWQNAYNWPAAIRALKIHFADRIPD